MMKAPPLLPAETLHRVVQTARLDGLSLFWLAGMFAVLSAYMGDRPGAVVGLLVAGAGALELHGTSLLTHGVARGMNWLLASQMVCFAVIMSYCAYSMMHVTIPPFPPTVNQMLEVSAKRMNMSRDEYVLMFYRLGFVLVALATILYQGGMAVYYQRRRSTIVRALSEES